VGFPHEFSGHQTKQSLVYDLQEPYRWLADVSVIVTFESGVLDMKDFNFLGGDYRYHIEVEAKRRFLQLLKDRFNSGVKHNGKAWKWDTVILNKTQELGRFLLDKSGQIDFKEPHPSLQRSDTEELRKRILELTQIQAKEFGIGRSTLHYLRKCARKSSSFALHQCTLKKLVRSTSLPNRRRGVQ